MSLTHHFNLLVSLFQTVFEFRYSNEWFFCYKPLSMESQFNKNGHFRQVLLYEFNRGVSPAQATKNICTVYGADAVAERTARKWFSRFKEGNFDLNDASRPGRPCEFDEDRLNALIHEEPRQSTRELASQMGVDHSTIARHLHSMGKVHKLGAWVPHVLTQSNKNQRVVISASLLARHRSARKQHEPFLSQIVTGDEKWCLYVNMKPRKEWVSPGKQAKARVKADLHPRKVLLCIWWDQKGVIYYELLPKNTTVTAEVYCEQLRRLSSAIEEKRPGMQDKIILQHDNARPHIARMTQAAIQELGWEVLPHPAYSPDLAPSDYHLFRSLANNLQGTSFINEADLKKWLDDFFDHKSASFYKRGIQKLPERWENVVNSGGEYIID